MTQQITQNKKKFSKHFIRSETRYKLDTPTFHTSHMIYKQSPKSYQYFVY